jgi:hypothetical protein
MGLPLLFVYGKLLLESEIFLDEVDETCPELLLLSVHRKNRYPRAASHDHMTAVARFEAAALFPKPSLEFLAGHVD